MTRQRSESWKTRALVQGERELSVEKFRVEVVDGPSPGLTAESEGLELSIGTAPGNQLVLVDAAVSRHHCVIRATPRGFVITDVGSTNGTRVGEVAIQEAYLEAGALLSVGETTLRFDCTGQRVSQRLSSSDAFGSVLGGSARMRRLFAMLERLADSDTTVLLTGETGTGKGALAEALHRQSRRSAGPLVVVDCAAIPAQLIESELFGHERGAFTGAHERRIGSIETASGGTLFLDEIGELPLDMQPKLLRVLEKPQVRRVGGGPPIAVDVRVVAATNRDLRQEVNAGAFREDLYYRLNVVGVEVPPLRERREDIPLLATHFYRTVSGQPDAALPAEMLRRLLRQRWPGNVRELRAAIERQVVLGELAHAGPASARALVPDELDLSISYREAKERAIRAWEAAYVPRLMRQYDGNLSRAARAVQMDRNHLRKLLRRQDPDQDE